MNIKKVSIKKLVVLMAIGGAALVALSRFFWYYDLGSVPTVEAISITPSWTINLPFGGVSRWYDVMIPPCWVALFAMMFSNEQIAHKDKLNVDEVKICLTVGLVSGILFALPGVSIIIALGPVTLVHALYYGLAVGLVISSASSVFMGLTKGVACFFAFGTMTSFAIGLSMSLVHGLIAQIIFTLIFSSALVLVSLKRWSVRQIQRHTSAASAEGSWDGL